MTTDQSPPAQASDELMRAAFEKWRYSLGEESFGIRSVPNLPPSAWAAWQEATRIAMSTPRATADVERGWISVADCMPPEGETVLTSGAKRVGMVVMQHTERDDWQIETASEWHSAYPPKFWMHLPPEPEVAK